MKFVTKFSIRAREKRVGVFADQLAATSAEPLSCQALSAKILGTTAIMLLLMLFCLDRHSHLNGVRHERHSELAPKGKGDC
jgi:hypothetical protein